MKQHMLIKLVASAAVALTLGACDKRDKEDILPGVRLNIDGEVVSEQSFDQSPSRAISLPTMSANADWTHRNGNASHTIRHPFLSSAPSLRWSRDIGLGNTKRAFLSADPIVADGRIFTLSSDGQVTALSPSGAQIWTQALALQSDQRHIISGGGLAYGGDRLFVTTGFGDVFAVNPATGTVNWRHKLNQAASGAPVYSNGKVIIVSGNSAVTALRADNGRISWSRDTQQSATGLLGAGGAAAAGRVAYIPFATGEVTATLVESGFQLWTQALSGGRAGVAREFVNAFSGEPVVTNDTVYVGTQAGKLTAINKRTGERRWTINDGALAPVWPVAGSLFMLSDENKLKRLDASDGSEIWSVTLPSFGKPEKAKDHIAHFGPILAGGQIILASTDGILRKYDPASGSFVGQLSVPDGAAATPAVAGGILYVLSSTGTLHAFQ